MAYGKDSTKKAMSPAYGAVAGKLESLAANKAFDLMNEGGEKLDLFPMEDYESGEIQSKMEILEEFMFDLDSPHIAEGERRMRDINYLRNPEKWDRSQWQYMVSDEFKKLSTEQEKALMDEYLNLRKQVKVGHQIGGIERDMDRYGDSYSEEADKDMVRNIQDVVARIDEFKQLEEDPSDRYYATKKRREDRPNRKKDRPRTKEEISSTASSYVIDFLESKGLIK